MLELLPTPEFIEIGGNSLDRGGRAFPARLEGAPPCQRLDRATDIDQRSGTHIAAPLVENRPDLFEARRIKDSRFLMKLLRLGSIRGLANLMTADRERRPVGKIQFLKTRQSADQSRFARKPSGQ